MGTFPSLALFLVSLAVCAAQGPKRPHIVFMIVDDLGWSDVSFHGSKQIPTPNIDAIARDGIILNQYYVQPSCSPSRGSLMTGKYPIRIGFQHEVIVANSPWGLPLKEKILPQYLKALQYSTHAVGKWHLGFFKEEYLPLKRGFDSFFGYYNGVEDYYTHFSEADYECIVNSGGERNDYCDRLSENRDRFPKTVQRRYTIEGNDTGLDLHKGYENAWEYNGKYGTELFTAKAKKIIQEHNPVKPLFLYFAQQAPHSGNFRKPLQVPDKYLEHLTGIDHEKRKIFAGMVSALDHSVGEIFQALEKSRMLDNTIFIFTTDNGGAVEGTDGCYGSNWPLKGSKYNLWEGGTRGVSFMWSPFLRHRQRVYNDLMHVSDWLPTILSAAGGPKALNMLKKIDGVDQWPALAHLLPSPRNEILLNIDDEAKVEGIRRGKFKLVKGSYYNGTFDGWYDIQGIPIVSRPPTVSPVKKLLYSKNYLRYLKRSKAARVLWRKYGKDPRLSFACFTPKCSEELEVKCGPRPFIDTCNPEMGPCLFDLARDPCEFYNIAEQLPEVTAELESALNKYRPLVVPAGGKPPDPAASPIFHGNAWESWM